jgi:hypothetical protein
MYASELFESLSQIYPILAEQIECRDAELFSTLPGLLIVRSLEREDADVCRHFYPAMFDSNESSGMIYRRLSRAFSLGKLAACSEEEYISLLE